MNLCLCLTHGNSLSDWKKNGTLARELEIYLKMIKEYGIKITIISYSTINEDYLLPSHVEKDFKIIYNKFNLPNILYLLNLIFLKSIFKNIDIFKSNQEHGAFIGLLLSIIYKKKFLFRSGFSLRHHLLKKYGYISLKYFYSYLNNLLCCGLSDKIIITSNNFINYYSFRNKKKKISIISNYFPYEIKNVEKKNYKKIYEFLYIGRLSSEKNYQLIYELAKKFPKKNFLVISSDKDKYKNQYKNITFKSKIENYRLSVYYKKTKFLLLPSKYEGNSKVLIETMIYGTPVLAKNGKGITESIKHLKTGFLFKDINQLIAIYKRYKDDNEVIKKIQKNAFKYAYENFSLNKIMKLEYENYRDLISCKMN